MRLLIVLFLIVAGILGFEAYRRDVSSIVVLVIAGVLLFLCGLGVVVRVLSRGRAYYGPIPRTRATERLSYRRLGSDGDTIIDTRTGRKQ